MSTNSTTPHRTLSSSSSTEDLFASPTQTQAHKNPRKDKPSEALPPNPASKKPGAQKDPTNPNPTLTTTDQTRETSLRNELAGIRTINQVIEGVNESLDRAKSNMETVSQTVTSAHTLLQTWTRILSQTEHNQRLLLNPSWQGASQDVADMQRENRAKEEQERERRDVLQQQQQQQQRREQEERARRNNGNGNGNKQQEEEEVGEGSTRRERGRGGGLGGRGAGRGRGTAGRGGVRGTGTTGGRAGSGAGRGVGRGTGVGRGRGRGVS
ncbi:hypothetical protein MMC24_001015 [Lignoscripta atroalba]|nr:hypothetical protein [Lignoscripta atroalba]